MTEASGIYRGWVRHRRYAPKVNQFKYQIFMMYLDLDELPHLFDPFRFWSARGKNLAEFRRSDHTGDSHIPLKAAIQKLVEENTGWKPDGRIRLLTHLRYFGYCMNPVSFYYCYSAHDKEHVKAIVAEVHNTPWQEEHCYVLFNNAHNLATQSLHFQFDKVFHVSPFMGMNQTYDWRFTQPKPGEGSSLLVHMSNLEQSQRSSADKIFDATMHLKRQSISAKHLNLALFRYPWMTASVVTKIHWQALKLYFKRIPVQVYPGRHEDRLDKPSSPAFHNA